MDNQIIKNIIEKEIKRHHKKEIDYRNCNRSKKKIVKHMHKRHELIELSKKLGFTFCECCGGLR